jgi:hypothetical protein
VTERLSTTSRNLRLAESVVLDSGPNERRFLMTIETSEPVDGYSVEHEGQDILLLFFNRYGHYDLYRFTQQDAEKVAAALRK